MQFKTKKQLQTLSILFTCLLMLCGCSSVGSKLDGKWVWAAKHNGQPLAKGFFNLVEEEGGKVLGTTSTIVDNKDPKTMAFVTLHFEGKREGNKLSFTVKDKGIKAVNEATIASNNKDLTGHTVQTMPYNPTLSKVGQAFKDPSGKQMIRVEYDWTATRFKE